MFDPPGRSPHSATPYDRIDCAEHRALALDAARASMVLLKNGRGILPLKRDLGCIAVIGPNADDRDVLLGNYAGRPSRSTTVLEGIRTAVGPKTRILYAPGSEITREDSLWWDSRADDGFAEALAAADAAEVVVMVLGLSSKLEGEEGAASRSQWNGDRISIDLPAIQKRLFAAVAAKGKPTVLVILTGSAIAMVEEDERADAVLLGWYPGEEGGTAVAEVLFGAHNPSGRLPVTFVKSLDQLPPFTDYEMKGRTYRYMTEEPLYPFGYGLSYAAFRYDKLTLPEKKPRAGASVTLDVEVTNTASRDGHEVVQVYVSAPAGTGPLRQLVGFQRVLIPAGASRKVTFTLGPRELSTIGDDGARAVRPGRYRIAVGGRQPDSRSAALTGAPVQEADLEITGTPHPLPA
jgi:beta-glucosidase